MILCPWNEILKYKSMLPGIEEAYEAVNALTSLEAATYPLSGGNRFFVAVGTTKAPDLAEAHRKYMDIQYIVKGQEVMGWAPLDTLELVGQFDESKDVGFYTGKFDLMRIGEGYCYVAFPEDGHMPTRYTDVPNDYTKIVVKLKV